MFKRLALCAALSVGVATLTEGVSLWTGNVAFAQKKAKRRKARKARKVKKPAAQPAEADERESAARFQWTERPTEADMDERADRKRDEAIAKLKRLIPTIDDGPQKADLYFRLSEMYWAKSKYKNLRAMQQWDTELDRWHQGGAKGPEPKLERFQEFDEARV
ncbi:MAG: hypothetical protein AAFY60_18120, partial [Myxococcota bacterium]